jgi:uncharacterized membrane-anchored protein
MKTTAVLFFVGTGVVFAAFNGLIAQKENLRRNGEIVLLRTAPRDPRSLMQGDYMALNYDLLGRAPGAGALSADGCFVVKLDEHNVATFIRVHTSETLGPDERLLRFRVRNNNVRVGPDSFFFQEGHAKYYERAQYAELRVTAAGDVLLTGLRGAKYEVLGPDR